MKHFFEHHLAIVTMLCVVGIFLFPVAVGPYSAVHGPVTALLAVRTAMKLRLAIALAALCNSIVSVSAFRSFPVLSLELISATPPQNLLNLRC
jgi:hypothetical protein